jgi:hypothetical protein
MMTTVYPASKAKHAEFWKALQAAGLPIVASWISWEGNKSDAKVTRDMWSRHWESCIEQAAAADICLFVSFKGEVACGSLIESGAALAAGKQVYVVSDDWFSFSHHPRCRVFPTLADAVAAITAQANGERMRKANGHLPYNADRLGLN